MVNLNVEDYPKILSQQIHSLGRHENLCDLKIVSSDGELATTKLSLFFGFPYLKTLAEGQDEVTIFLPDVAQSDVEFGLEQFYLLGDTEALAAVLDAFVTNGQEHENTMDDNDLALEEDKCDEQSGDDFSDPDDKDQFEAGHEYSTEEHELINFNNEFDDSAQIEFGSLITSTGVKKNPFTSLTSNSLSTLGSCFFNLAENENLSESQDPFNSMIWNQHLEQIEKTESENTAQETTQDSGCQYDAEIDFSENSSELSCNFPTLDTEPTSCFQEENNLMVNFQNNLVLGEILDKTKEKALTKLTNVEFWIQHFDKSFTSARVKQALEDGWDDPELSESLIKTFLDNMNTHLAQTYPLQFNSTRRKNFFPKLANILMKRLPIIFGDYLNKVDIENFNAEEPNMQIEDKIDNHERQPKSKKDKIPEEYLKIIEESDHGKHNIEIRFNQRKSAIIFCDGYPFLPESCVKSQPGVNNYYLRCSDNRTCKSFMKIKNGKIISYPRHRDHRNHPVSKASKMLKESRD